jgi:hypothetical protein
MDTSPASLLVSPGCENYKLPPAPELLVVHPKRRFFRKCPLKKTAYRGAHTCRPESRDQAGSHHQCFLQDRNCRSAEGSADHDVDSRHRSHHRLLQESKLPIPKKRSNDSSTRDVRLLE